MLDSGSISEHDNQMFCNACYRWCIGPLHPAFHRYGNRVASVIGFSVLCSLLHFFWSYCSIIYNIWLPHPLANCDVCEADFAVRVKLTRHIKTDSEYNCDVCRKRIWIIIQAEGSCFLRKILVPPNMTGYLSRLKSYRAEIWNLS